MIQEIALNFQKEKGGFPYYGQIHGLIMLKKLKDGNERVIAILITTSQDICIINTYMPTCNTDSQYEYRECLDIVYDIIQKYQESHKIILCGDLNGTLLDSRNNKHDKILKSFVSEMGLSTGVDKDERHTFFHHAWSSSSQIDYILVNDKKLISKYNIDEKSSINLSAHTSVTVKTTIEIPANTKPAIKNKKAKFKLQWDKIDKRQYNNLIQQDSTSIIEENNVNTQMDMVTNSLIRAGNITIPKKLLQLKGPKWKASPEVQILLRSCRDLYKQWQEVGKQKDHPMATMLRNEKRKLRSKVRMEQALSRQNLYQQIMDNPNSQLFYRLINRNRSNQQTSTNCLKIDENYNYVPEEQRKSFAKYYEDLSVPKENIYENGYLNLCKIRQQLYEQAIDKAEDPEQFTESEVMKAIGKLNTKKKIIDCSKRKSSYSWTMGGKVVKTSDCSEHLGIKRTDGKEHNFNIKERIQTARRTKYALMGSGVHGTNGLNPAISYQIYKTYVIPRLTYGLEVLPLTKSNIEELEIFHRKNLRHLQSLPERTSNAVVLLLLGALPIEAEIHKRHLSLLYSILSCDNSKIKDVMIRQIATNYDNKKSFFSRILNILEMYDLPSINYLQKNLPKRDIWKEEIKKKVNQYWNAQLKSEARNKTSLKNMNIENLEIGKTAQVWNLQNQPRLELRKAIIKARMMTGAYILQSDKHKFTHFVAEPLCQLCNTENEDIIHMVTSCPVLSTIREKYYVEMKMEILDNIDPIKWNTFCCNKMEITQLILDCNNFKETLNISSELMTKIEEKCRNLLFQLHAKRIEVLDALNNK
ncbi:unnamed protein product [Mytilus edulis]|uniref:Endonuclease/exonuclease/phosphatase domain-containing protein n=1 Tax=Mytilus edulis TaxID=6550 RepID=A0A8S3THB5_MYTED|nr:unnamed protein product [Mytilus edulis]